MLAAERQRRLLDLARKNGTVRTTDLATDFSVTEETIRRDLDFLARMGHLRRTHGGAMDTSVSLGELSQSEREARQLEEKISIGREAATLVKEGETLLLDASSTALEFAAQLPNGMRLRVVSYSLAVIERLATREDIELVQLGGTYERRGRRFSGMLTESALRALRIDRFFFSGGGYDPVLGVGEPNPDQARFKRMMLEHSAWKCVLIDNTKLGATTDHFFAKPEELDALVSDQGGKSYAKKYLKTTPFTLHFR
jgi:DeoR/GlpR family transcriptional regulator of sugar metabolism